MADFTLTTEDEGVPTHTSDEQQRTEETCRDAFEQWLNADGSVARDACARGRRPILSLSTAPSAARVVA